MKNQKNEPDIIHLKYVGLNDKVPKAPEGYSTIYFGGCVHHIKDAYADTKKDLYDAFHKAKNTKIVRKK
ncbi:hypothetical protein [Candidatus Liberibacter brunswickensis]|uniref:hypothetical protein n=1 Tax=Candidatus Liberibacter brunswickensis TaxID=1968796 RepID=UPI002FE3B9AF